MSFEDALRLTEVLLGFALLQQSLEHLAVPRDRVLFAGRALLSTLLVLGFAPSLIGLLLLASSLMILGRFDGPYNGGADRMSILALVCLTLAHLLPEPRWREMAFGYLAVQLVLSYVLSGWVKLRHGDWRSGRALQDVFAFSVYPVADNLRVFAARPKLMRAASWGVIGFELAFPLFLITPASLSAGLLIAGLFHGANACLFGLNRFVWAWLAAFPSLIWLQERVFG